MTLTKERTCSFRLNTQLKGTGPSSIFVDALPESLEGQVAIKNMDESSFNSAEDSLQKTLTQPKEAYFDYIQTIQANAMFCEVT